MKIVHHKKAAIMVPLTTIALVLSACGSGDGDSSADSSKGSDTKKNPVLSVPKTTDNKSVRFKLDPGDVESGQDYHVAAYGGGFNGQKSDCSEEIASTDGKFGDHETAGAVQVKQPGTYQLVLSTDGHASACDDEKATTTVKTKPKVFLDGDLSSDGAKTVQAQPGKPFEVAVVMSGDIPDSASVPVDLEIHGPYSTEPELRAAKCDDDKVASRQTVNWTGDDTNRSDKRFTTGKVTVDGTKGLYLVTAKTQETDEVATAESECDNYQSSLKVSTKGDGASSESGSDSTSGEGTNGLTGHSKSDNK